MDPITRFLKDNGCYGAVEVNIERDAGFDDNDLAAAAAVTVKAVKSIVDSILDYKLGYNNTGIWIDPEEEI